jgi:hypothetical protein
MANFAFVVDTTVFHTVYMDEKNETAFKWIHALRSDPIFVNVNDCPFVAVWWKFKDGYFYEPSDTEYLTKYEKQIKDPLNKNLRFAGIVEGEVFGFVSFESEHNSDEMLEMLNAGFQSNPKIVEYSSSDTVRIGYTWDGESFYEENV